MLIETTASDAWRDEVFGNTVWFRVTGVATIPFKTPFDLKTYYEEWSRFFTSSSKHDYRAAVGALGGYFPLASERAAGAPEADPKEFFHVLKDVTLPPELRDATQELFESLASTVRRSLHEVARVEPTACGVASTLSDESRMVLRVTRYHASPPRMKDAAAAHTDVDLLTLLPPATVPGLLILDPIGRWTPMSPREDQAILLVGDMLEHVTKGAIKAARHRVASSGSERLSLSFFANPTDETALDAHLKAGDIVAAKLRAMTSHES